MYESVGTALPDDLELIPAGPRLAAVLASLDRSGMDPGQLLRLARARDRLVAHQQAQLLADLHAVARAAPAGSGAQVGSREPDQGRWAECEVGFALRWSHRRAAGQLAFGEEVIDRLPAVFDTLDRGAIDVPKARVIVDAVAALDDQLARAIVDAVLDKAPRQTTGELRARLRRLVAAADPDASTKKAARGHAERRVVASLDDNSLATLTGCELAPHRVAAAMERLDAIAKAAKAAGDRRRMDQLRADAYLDLLVGDGVATGGPVSDGGLGNGREASAAESGAGVLTNPEHFDAGEVTSAEQAFGGDHLICGDQLVDGDQVDEAWRREIDRLSLAGFDQLPRMRPASATCPRCGAGRAATRHASTAPTVAGRPSQPAMPAPRSGVVDIQVPLTSLIGLSRLPGELSGWGPVVADIARQVVAQQRSVTWRFSVYNRLGELAHHGITRARPAHRKRRPTAEVASFVRARDRRCVAPGCRRAARSCDLDHTLDWVLGGESDSCNLGLLCRMHHLFKHTSGCELLQLSSGVFAWTTPAGRQYLTTPEVPLLEERDLPGAVGATAVATGPPR